MAIRPKARGGRDASLADCAERGILGLTQIDLINQIFYFRLRFPRETTNPLADGAENNNNQIILCELITNFCAFCERLSGV